MKVRNSHAAAITQAARAIFIACCLSVVPAGTGLAEQPIPAPEYSLTILHTNDLHSHNEPFIEGGRTVGGMARIAHVVRAIKAKTPHVLTVDAGDIFQGTPFFKFYHGDTDVAILNQIGYDVYTIGNHEFDDGPDNLAERLKAAKFDVVSSNIDVSQHEALAAIVKPSVVKTVDGEKIGFVGAITPDLVKVSLKTGLVKVKNVWDIKPPTPPPKVDGPAKPSPQDKKWGWDKDEAWLTPIRDEVAKLKAEGVNKIILVTHTGVELDRQLASAIPDVDAIIGGHSHTRLNQSIIIPHKDGSKTVIVQTGCYGRALGRLDLSFDRKGRVMLPHTRYSLINITDKIEEEPDIKAYVDEKGKPVRELRNKLAGIAMANFDNHFSRYPWDAPIGDLVCDAIAEAGTEYGATISFQNRGGIRAGIDRGPVSLEKVEEVLPFDNRLIFATVKGSILRKALEHSVSGILGAHFLDVHGLRVAYDPTKPAGEKLVFVMTQDADGRWSEIAPDKTYKIATNDFTLMGGEGYNFRGATVIRPTTERLSAVLTAYMIKHQKVSPEPPSRIIPVRASLLALEHDGSKSVLKLVSPIPADTVTVVLGQDKGGCAIPGPLPVPVADAEVVVAGKTDAPVLERAQYVYTWTLPLRRSDRASQPVEPGWAAVLIHPPKPRTAQDTIITAPVALK